MFVITGNETITTTPTPYGYVTEPSYGGDGSWSYGGPSKHGYKHWFPFPFPFPFFPYWPPYKHGKQIGYGTEQQPYGGHSPYGPGGEPPQWVRLFMFITYNTARLQSSKSIKSKKNLYSAVYSTDSEALGGRIK